jgi:maltose O-acetyltransferase
MEKYNMRNSSLPALKPIVKLCFKLYALPLVNKLSFLKNKICKEIGIPLSTQFNNKFYCTSGRLKLGHNVSLADTFILDYAWVSMGNNVSFSYKNTIITSTHDLADFNTVLTMPVTIGSNVWITTGVIILPGVTIGSNVIIGAGSVVSRDIPSGVFAAGNPCKPVKNIDFKM